MIDENTINRIEELVVRADANGFLGTDKVSDQAAIVIPDNHHLVNLESYLPGRRRFRGSYESAVIPAFVDYVRRQQDKGGCQVFVDPENMTGEAYLNLGTVANPGHADSVASLTLKKTAPYKALLALAGRTFSQRQMAEHLEDWRDFFDAQASDESEMTATQVIAAIRRINTEAKRQSDSAEEDMKSQRSVMESYEVSSSAGKMPAFLRFTCEPYQGLDERTFLVRLSLKGDDDGLQVGTRIVRMEQHDEEMAEEFAGILEDCLGEHVPVTIGTFDPRK